VRGWEIVYWCCEGGADEGRVSKKQLPRGQKGLFSYNCAVRIPMNRSDATVHILYSLNFSLKQIYPAFFKNTDAIEKRSAYKEEHLYLISGHRLLVRRV
jgi:hypothetical protein